MMSDDARRILLWGLEAVAWVFRGADGGRWSQVRTDCLPKLAGILLFLQSRGLVDVDLLDLAEQVHLLADENASAMTPENLEAEYVRLFVNHRGGTSVPLCQSCYTGEGLMMGDPAVAMQSRLDRAGLKVDMTLGMPPDHIAIELVYLMSLFPEHLPQSALTPTLSPTSSADDSLGESPAEFASQVLSSWVGELQKRTIEAQASPLFHLAVSVLVVLNECIKDENAQIKNLTRA
ncbi:chaperone TorD involved in molybdoenzyme TorA maturation [Desulfonatronum zhilinae]|nr:chaperone TorD involved in molybdoenzyme TorA maturation [Desulfonatronum zhilinae]